MQLLIPCGFSISSHLQFSQGKSSGSLADWIHQPSLVVLVSTRGTWLVPAANFHLSGCSTAMFLCFVLDNNENNHMPVFPLVRKATGMSASSLLLQPCCTKAEALRRERYDVNSWARGEKRERAESPSLLSHHTGTVESWYLVTLPFLLLMAAMHTWKSLSYLSWNASESKF